MSEIARTDGGTRANAAPRPAASQFPDALDLSLSDLVEVVAAGLRDFRAAPQFGLFFGGFYAVGGWCIMALLWIYQQPFFAYPLAMGFALLAPFVVTGVYDISRRLERGEALTWRGILSSVWDAKNRDLRWMALVTSFTFFIWMDIAAILYLSFYGFKTQPLLEFVVTLFTTTQGLIFLIVGNSVGAVIALFVFSYSVISFPMLFDRDVDFVTAMATSVKVLIKNPKVMAIWCAFIAVMVAMSILSGFVGLFVTLPILGHASWHLYRRAIPPAS